MVATTDNKVVEEVHQNINKVQENIAKQKEDEIKELNIKDEAKAPTKRKRGRPAKLNGKPKPVVDPSLPKRKRGRPKKIVA